MEEKDMRFEETENVEDIEESGGGTPRRSGIGAFGAIAFGGGLALGGIALFKKLKKAVAAKKAAKEAASEYNEVVIEDIEETEEAEPQPETQV